MKSAKTISTLLSLCLISCSNLEQTSTRLVPAEEFSRSLNTGQGRDFSIFRVAEQQEARGALARLENAPDPSRPQMNLKRSYEAPQTMFAADGDVANRGPARLVSADGAPTIDQLRQPPRLPQLPPGSQSPYTNGQMTANPSLWPDEGQSANLFTDFRAFQAMDVITILVNESNTGKKTTKANSEGSFSIVAGIAALLGFETGWESNNEGLSADNLVSASTESKFEGKGEMKREGAMKAKLSAVILEVLPNGLLRVEGTKIVAVDKEEEVMVVSGLVRQRDIDAQNQVESNRIANMRIDFYGRGLLADQQSPGWAAQIITKVWPF